MHYFVSQDFIPLEELLTCPKCTSMSTYIADINISYTRSKHSEETIPCYFLPNMALHTLWMNLPMAENTAAMALPIAARHLPIAEHIAARHRPMGVQMFSPIHLQH